PGRVRLARPPRAPGPQARGSVRRGFTDTDRSSPRLRLPSHRESARSRATEHAAESARTPAAPGAAPRDRAAGDPDRVPVGRGGFSSTPKKSANHAVFLAPRANGAHNAGRLGSCTLPAPIGAPSRRACPLAGSTIPDLAASRTSWVGDPTGRTEWPVRRT